MTEVRSGTRKPCQFPFVLLNQTFNECTNILDVDLNTGKITTVDELWCSTKGQLISKCLIDAIVLTQKQQFF